MNTVFIVLLGIIGAALVVWCVCFWKLGRSFSNEGKNAEVYSDVVTYLLKRCPDDKESQQRIKTTFGNIAKEKERVSLEIEQMRKRLNDMQIAYHETLLHSKNYRIAAIEDLKRGIKNRQEELVLLLQIEECWQQFFETLDYYILDEELPELRRNWYYRKLQDEGADSDTLSRCWTDKAFEFPNDF